MKGKELPELYYACIFLFAVCAILSSVIITHILIPKIGQQQNDEFNVVSGNTRVCLGEIYAIDVDNKEVIFLLADGTLHKTQVQNCDNFDVNGYYAIFFDTNGTKQFNDDEIVDTFIECW